MHACLSVSTDMGCFVTWQGPRFKDEKGESPIDGLGRPGWILVDISTYIYIYIYILYSIV